MTEITTPHQITETAEGRRYAIVPVRDPEGQCVWQVLDMEAHPSRRLVGIFPDLTSVDDYLERRFNVLREEQA